jgi:transposase
MATSGRGSGMVGYNVQTAVDAKHHLIVAHEVTNVGHDRGQLANMGAQAKAEMGVESLDVLADRGYFSGEEVLACEPLGVTPYVPKPLTSGAKADGRFGKQDFIYRPRTTPTAAAGEALTRRFTSVETHGPPLLLDDAMRGLAAEARCTSGRPRRIKRWEHEAVIDAMQARLDRMPKAMRIRRAPVEHVSGRSRPGWARPTSRPGRWKRSEPS